jgi:hypothetical protein
MMTMLRNLRTYLLIAAILSVAVTGFAQRPCPPYDPGCQERKQAGRSDSKPNRINPSNTDYGQMIEDARARAIADVLHDPLFRAVSVALIVLPFVGYAIFHQHKERRHQQIIAARFLAWYHNQLMDARERVLEEINKFQRFRDAVDARLIAQATTAGSMTSATGNARSANEEALDVEINSLRQKAALMEKTEKALRLENSELKRLFRESRDKTRAAKQESNGGPTAAGKEAEDGRKEQG